MSGGWTPFPDLDAVLRDLVAAVGGVLATDLIGVYLVGSFAVGGADEHSDVDFLVVTRSGLSTDHERRLRTVHAGFPRSAVVWAQHLEGSYAPAAQLRRLDGEPEPWLYVDNGSGTMQWSTHDNNAVVRWSLRERGIALCGPPPAGLVPEVPSRQLRDEAHRALRALVEQLPGWAGLDNAWAQPYVVTSLCRMLATLSCGRVVAKSDALTWAGSALGARWQTLLAHAAADRPDPWRRVGLSARAGSVSETRAFAAAAAAIASGSALPPYRHFGA